MRGRMLGSVLGLVLSASSLLQSAVHAAPLYATGFAPPVFVPGPLAGQDGWFTFEGKSISAGTVSTQLPESGVQSVRIQGSQLELSSTLGICGGSGFLDSGIS